MRRPENVKMKILTNPWFLWLLVLLGVNPAMLIGQMPSVASEMVQSESFNQRFTNR